MEHLHTGMGRQWIALLLSVGLGLLYIGCGVKAAPRPPMAQPLPGINNLQAVVDKERVILSWESGTIRNRETIGFAVFSSKTALDNPPCKGCPLIFQKIGSVAAADSDGGKRQTYRFVDDVETGFHYVFRVRAVAADGALGPESKSVPVDIP